MVQVVANVGFPIAITIYLLRNFGVKLDALDTSIQHLCKAIESNQLRKD